MNCVLAKFVRERCPTKLFILTPKIQEFHNRKFLNNPKLASVLTILLSKVDDYIYYDENYDIDEEEKLDRVIEKSNSYLYHLVTWYGFPYGLTKKGQKYLKKEIEQIFHIRGIDEIYLLPELGSNVSISGLTFEYKGNTYAWEFIPDNDEEDVKTAAFYAMQAAEKYY